MGIDVKLKTIVGDDESRLEETIRDAIKRSEIVIATGGLGPTEDDRSREALATVIGVPLLEDARAAAIVDEYFRRAGRVRLYLFAR